MKVRFLIEVNEESGIDPYVLAVFPETESTGGVDCYAHLGQHSVARPDYVKTLKPATKEQYKALARELTVIGYDLEIEGE